MTETGQLYFPGYSAMRCRGPGDGATMSLVRPGPWTVTPEHRPRFARVSVHGHPRGRGKAAGTPDGLARAGADGKGRVVDGVGGADGARRDWQRGEDRVDGDDR